MEEAEKYLPKWHRAYEAAKYSRKYCHFKDNEY